MPLFSARTWIQTLKLRRHPEGGYYRETYRSPEQIAESALPKRYRGARVFSTVIYYLLEKGDFSAFHRVQSDEMWYYHAGCPVQLTLINTKGRLRTARLGLNVRKKERPQILIPRGTWFCAAPLSAQASYSLVGCSVAPGFDFGDFEMASRQELLRLWPKHRKAILKWTRGG